MKIIIQERETKDFDFRVIGELGEVILYSEGFPTERDAIINSRIFINSSLELYKKYNIENNGPLRENKHFEIRRIKNEN